MSEETKVDKDYKEAFNLGYELAKELKLKSPMFKDVTSGNNRTNAIQAGMQEFNKEIILQKDKKIDTPLGLDVKGNSNKDKGFEHSI